MMFGLPLLYLKIGAGAVILAAMLFAGHKIADHWRAQGRTEIQVQWDKAEQIRHTAEQEATKKRNAENAKQVLINEAKNKEVRREYERRIELQNRNNAADIAALRAHGGLRVSQAICSGFASKANPPSTEGNNEAGTSRLPSAIEDGLFAFAGERDEVIVLLGSCQKWIKDNGFYKE